MSYLYLTSVSVSPPDSHRNVCSLLMSCLSGYCFIIIIIIIIIPRGDVLEKQTDPHVW